VLCAAWIKYIFGHRPFLGSYRFSPRTIIIHDTCFIGNDKAASNSTRIITPAIPFTTEFNEIKRRNTDRWGSLDYGTALAMLPDACTKQRLDENQFGSN
jgi:hypothetical protein